MSAAFGIRPWRDSLDDEIDGELDYQDAEVVQSGQEANRPGDATNAPGHDTEGGSSMPDKTSVLKLAEDGQYVCPGSIFIPVADGRCLCGHPREAHVWEHAGGAGAFRRIESDLDAGEALDEAIYEQTGRHPADA